MQIETSNLHRGKIRQLMSDFAALADGDIVAFELLDGKAQWRWALGAVVGVPRGRLVNIARWTRIVAGGNGGDVELKKAEDRLLALTMEGDSLQAEYARLRTDLARQRRVAEDDEQFARTVLQRAAAGIEHLDDATWREVRSYKSPPQNVSIVLQAVLALMTGKIHASWDAILPLIRKQTFVTQLAQFDPEGIDAATAQLVSQNFLGNPRFTEENAWKGSRAAGPLYDWVKAQMSCCRAASKLSEIESEAAERNRLLDDLNAKMEANRARVDELEAEMTAQREIRNAASAKAAAAASAASGSSNAAVVEGEDATWQIRADTAQTILRSSILCAFGASSDSEATLTLSEPQRVALRRAVEAGKASREAAVALQESRRLQRTEAERTRAEALSYRSKLADSVRVLTHELEVTKEELFSVSTRLTATTTTTTTTSSSSNSSVSDTITITTQQLNAALQEVEALKTRRMQLEAKTTTQQRQIDNLTGERKASESRLNAEIAKLKEASDAAAARIAELEQQAAAKQAAAAEALVQAASEASCGAPKRPLRRVVVMRHGERVDCIGDAPAQPDPSLTADGKKAAATTASRLLREALGVRAAASALVVSSPFARCVETAEALAAGGVGAATPVVVDNSICEVFGPLRIKPAKPAVLAAQSDASRGLPLPAWGETVLDAEERFVQAFEAYATDEKERSGSGDDDNGRTVVLVTHGDALNMIMRLVYPSRTVYEANFLSFLVFTPSRNTGSAPAAGAAVSASSSVARHYELEAASGVAFLDGDGSGSSGPFADIVDDRTPLVSEQEKLKAQLRDLTEHASAAKKEAEQLRAELTAAEAELRRKLADAQQRSDEQTRQLKAQDAQHADQASKLQQANAKLEQDLAKLKQEVEALRSSLAKSEADASKAAKELAAAQAALTTQEATLAQEADKLRSSVAAAEKEKSKLAAELEASRSEVSTVRQELQTTVSTHTTVIEQHKREIAQITSESSRTTATTKKQDETLRQLKAQDAQHADQASKLQQANAKLEQDLAKLKQEVEALRSSLAKSEADASKAAKELAAAQAALTTQEATLAQEADKLRSSVAAAEKEKSKLAAELEASRSEVSTVRQELQTTVSTHTTVIEQHKREIAQITSDSSQSSLVTSANTRLQQEISKLNDEVDALRSSLSIAEEKATSAEIQLASVNVKLSQDSGIHSLLIAAAEEEKTKLSSELSAVRNTILSCQEANKTLEHESVKLRQELDLMRSSLSKCEEDSATTAKALLSSETRGDSLVLENSKLAASVSRSDAEISKLTLDVSTFRDHTAKLEEEVAKLNKELGSLRSSMSEAEDGRNEAAKELEALRHEATELIAQVETTREELARTKEAHAAAEEQHKVDIAAAHADSARLTKLVSEAEELKILLSKASADRDLLQIQLNDADDERSALEKQLVSSSSEYQIALKAATDRLTRLQADRSAEKQQWEQESQTSSQKLLASHQEELQHCRSQSTAVLEGVCLDLTACKKALESRQMELDVLRRELSEQAASTIDLDQTRNDLEKVRAELAAANLSQRAALGELAALQQHSENLRVELTTLRNREDVKDAVEAQATALRCLEDDKSLLEFHCSQLSSDRDAMRSAAVVLTVTLLWHFPMFAMSAAAAVAAIIFLEIKTSRRLLFASSASSSSGSQNASSSIVGGDTVFLLIFFLIECFCVSQSIQQSTFAGEYSSGSLFATCLSWCVASLIYLLALTNLISNTNNNSATTSSRDDRQMLTAPTGTGLTQYARKLQQHFLPQSSVVAPGSSAIDKVVFAFQQLLDWRYSYEMIDRSIRSAYFIVAGIALTSFLLFAALHHHVVVVATLDLDEAISGISIRLSFVMAAVIIPLVLSASSLRRAIQPLLVPAAAVFAAVSLLLLMVSTKLGAMLLSILVGLMWSYFVAELLLVVELASDPHLTLSLTTATLVAVVFTVGAGGAVLTIARGVSFTLARLICALASVGVASCFFLYAQQSPDRGGTGPRRKSSQDQGVGHTPTQPSSPSSAMMQPQHAESSQFSTAGSSPQQQAVVLVR